MKRKIIFCFLLLIFYNFNISYGINESQVYIKANRNEILKKEEFETTIYLENSKTAAFQFEIYFDDSKVECLSSSENSNVVKNRVIYVWHDETGGSNLKNGAIVKLRWKAKEAGIVNFIIEGEFYNSEAELIPVKFKSEQITIQDTIEEQKEESNKADNVDLQILRLNREGITPAFQKDIKKYYLTVSNNVNEIEIEAIPENNRATVEISENKNLKEGVNEIKVTVISEDKTKQQTYTIQVTKTDNVQNANTNLETLAIENQLLNPPFYTDITKYELEVPNEVLSLNILAIPEDEKATIEIKKEETLQEGDNKILVMVTAANGFTEKQYEILVHRRNKQEEEKYEEEHLENTAKEDEIYEVDNTKVNTEEQKMDEEENKESEEENKVNTITENKNYQIEIALTIILLLVSTILIIKKILQNH